MRTKVCLHGALAREVGRANWEFEVDTPAETLRAIEVNSGNLLKHLYSNMDTEYRFVMDGKDVTDLNQLGLGEVGEIHVIPVLKGAGGSGQWLAIIGVVIIALVVGLATAGIGTVPAAAGASGFLGLGVSLGATSAFFLTIGVSLTLGGIAQMISPTPSVENTERPENKPSYIYNGPVNTYRQGNPVPFGAGGPLRTGSQVISAGIRSIDIVN